VNKDLSRKLRKAKEAFIDTKDHKIMLQVMEKTLSEEDIDTYCDEYLELLNLMAMIHRRLEEEEGEDREYHLLEERRLHTLLLEDPYSYLDPHARISSEFEIKHIDLELAGVSWRRPERVEEGELDA
jgi:hypothetical protein